MTIARVHLVDPLVSRWYHCITRCVRRAKLLGEKQDRNPLAAGIAAVPEASDHTSIKQRVDHVAAQGRTEDLKAARTSSAVASKQAAGLEEKHWLCPVEDRRRIDSTREGMIEGFSLGSYLLLVDYTARLFRERQGRRSPVRWPRSSTACTPAPSSGRRGSTACARDVPWAASSRPPARDFAKSARG